MRKVAIGIQNFEDIITNNYYYIDKTSFIKEWWEYGDSVTLITRPSRFGKTLNMSMIECFFSIGYANRGDLFEHLFIWKEETYQKLQGTYPVINLSFANIKEDNFYATKMKIYQVIVALYEQNYFLLESGILKATEKQFFHSVCMDMPEYVATSAISKMSSFLRQYYGKKVIILLDEYDTPMQEAYEKGYWEELVTFTRSFFNTTFKANTNMERGIMTGITRVSKESIFSDLNHLEVVTTTSNKYETDFGFTEKEVLEALKEYGLEEEKEKVKVWYNGFIFGDCHNIYNPWSILNFLNTKKYGTYWVNTSSNGMVSQLIQKADRRLKSTFEKLLKGEIIRCPIDEQIVYSQLDENEEAIFSLFVASGYLKILDYERMDLIASNKEPLYDLFLTNYEVKRMFNSMIKSWFSKVRTDYNDFVKAMLENDIDGMNVYMNEITVQIFSYFDTGKGIHREEPERFYHGFVLGLIVELSEEYIITSNRESGLGRYDVMIEPKNKEKEAMIIEFKLHNPKKEQSLEETVKVALAQIEKKQYEASLLTKGFQKEQIYKYGFAFEGKNVLIGE